MAVQDEKCIVDSHGKPEHDAENRGGRRELVDRGQRKGDCGGDSDTDEGSEHGKPRANQGAQHHEQGDSGDRETDNLTRPEQ